MGGRARSLVLAGALLAALATAVPASACRVDITLDRLWYAAGEIATMTGFASGPGAESATLVRVTLGEGGPVLGEGAPSADGSIRVSFAVPALPAGKYGVYADAYDAAGVRISPLPGSDLLTIEAPPAAQETPPPGVEASAVEEPAAAVQTPAVAPAERPQTPRVASPRPAPRSAPAPAPAVPSPGRVLDRKGRPGTILVVPAAGSLLPAGETRPAARPVVTVAPSTPFARATERPLRRVLAAPATPRPADEEPGSPWLALVLAGLIALGGSVALGLAVLDLRRRRLAHDLEVEAALQELIAETRAAARERELV